MENKKEKATLISVAVNLGLAGGKLAAGFFTGSAAIIADGIHSGLDVLSSAAAYFGIKAAAKTEDEKHPYGYHISETLAGLVVVVLLAVSAIWIGYEGINGIITGTRPTITVWGFAVIIASIGLNEVLARYKMKIGQAEDSLALVADGQHSRADVISSTGVLAGLFLVKYIPVADGVVAILIGLYILYESWGLGRETVDQLIGVSDEEAEADIRKILAEKNIDLSELRTRRIGSASFAEITVKLDSKLKVEEAETVTKRLQEDLLAHIRRLEHVVIQVESHQYKTGTIRPRYGRRVRWSDGYDAGAKYGIGEKRGWRRIIPLKSGEIHSELGAPQYLVIDTLDKETPVKRIIDNPDFNQETGRAMRIVKDLSVDEIMTKSIGAGAQSKAEELGVKITVIDNDKKLNDIIG